jgi:hypothetical protein
MLTATPTGQPPAMAECPTADSPEARQELIRVYEMIWRNMERENTLINYRASWGLGLSAGIFTAQALLAHLLGSDRLYNILIFVTMFLLSLIALFFSWGARCGVNAALNQIDYLRAHYWSFGADECVNVFQSQLRLPRPFGVASDHESGHLAARRFPLAMMIIWGVAAGIEFAAIVAIGILAK